MYRTVRGPLRLKFDCSTNAVVVGSGKPKATPPTWPFLEDPRAPFPAPVDARVIYGFCGRPAETNEYSTGNEDRIKPPSSPKWRHYQPAAPNRGTQTLLLYSEIVVTNQSYYHPSQVVVHVRALPSGGKTGQNPCTENRCARPDNGLIMKLMFRR